MNEISQIKTLKIITRTVGLGMPKPTVLVIIFKVFIWLLSFINVGKKNNVHLLRFEILLQAEGQDNLRKKVITMEPDNH